MQKLRTFLRPLGVGAPLCAALIAATVHAAAAKPVTQLQVLNAERSVMHCRASDAQCVARSYGDTVGETGAGNPDFHYDPSMQRVCRFADLDGRIFDMLYFDDLPPSPQPSSYAYVAFTPGSVAVYSGLMGARKQRELTTAAVEADVASFLNIVPHINHHYSIDGDGYMKNLFYNPYTKYRCTVMTRDAGARETGDLVVTGYRPAKNGIAFRKIYVVFRPMSEDASAR